MYSQNRLIKNRVGLVTNLQRPLPAQRQSLRTGRDLKRTRSTFRQGWAGPNKPTRVAAPSPRASLGRRAVCGRTEQRRPPVSKCYETKVRMGVWGSLLIASAALKAPTRNGYNAQGVNLTFRFLVPRIQHVGAEGAAASWRLFGEGRRAHGDAQAQARLRRQEALRRHRSALRIGRLERRRPQRGRDAAAALCVYIYMCIYIYNIYICVCVCVCVCKYIHVYIYIYVYI